MMEYVCQEFWHLKYTYNINIKYFIYYFVVKLRWYIIEIKIDNKYLKLLLVKFRVKILDIIL
jgi:hypothetical protein